MPDCTVMVVTDAIVEMWNAGKSAGEIAAILSARYRRLYTRNQVMGRVSRAQAKGRAVRKWTTANTPSVLVTRRRMRPRPRLRAVREVVQAQRVQSSPALPFDELALPSGSCLQWHAGGGCAFLLGEDAAAPRWCNAPIVPRSPWCAYHYRQLRI